MRRLHALFLLVALTVAYGGVIALVGEFHDYHVAPNGRLFVLTETTIAKRLGLGGIIGLGFAAVTLAVLLLSAKSLHNRWAMLRLFPTLFIGLGVCLFLFADFNMYVHFGRGRYPDAVHTGIWVKGIAAWPERLLLSVLAGFFLSSSLVIPGILTTGVSVLSLECRPNQPLNREGPTVRKTSPG